MCETCPPDLPHELQKRIIIKYIKDLEREDGVILDDARIEEIAETLIRTMPVA